MDTAIALASLSSLSTRHSRMSREVCTLLACPVMDCVSTRREWKAGGGEIWKASTALVAKHPCNHHAPLFYLSKLKLLLKLGHC